MLTLIALPLYVLARTHSAAATGIAGAFATAPVVLGGALGGVLVDRIGYRRSSITADTVSGVTIATVPVLQHAVGLAFWPLMALVFVSGLLDTPGQTARSALLPEAAAAAEVPLERAVGLFEASERTARLVGAPLAGLLVTLMGALNVLAVDSATFLASAVIVSALVPRLLGTAPGSPDRAEDISAVSRGGYWSQLRNGLHFVLREPLLRVVVGLLIITNLFDSAKSTVLLPIASEREFGSDALFGVLVGVTGGGALLGAVVFSVIGHRLPRRATFVTAFAMVGGPPFLALAARLPLPALVPVFAVAGIASGAVNPTIGALKLERVPPGMRARIYGVIAAGAWLAMPLGSVCGGLAVTHFGLTGTLVAVGLCYLLVTLAPLLGGPWRGMSQRPTEPQEVLAQGVQRSHLISDS
jgi:MFS family permease